MSNDQLVFIAATFIIILFATLAAQFHWLPEGMFKTIVLFVAGVASMLSLLLANVPPKWFSGSKDGFLMALTFAAMGFVARAGEARAFGLPMLLGMSLTLLVANVIRLIARVL